MPPTEEQKQIPEEIQDDPRFFVDRVAVLSIPSESTQQVSSSPVIPSPLASDQLGEIARLTEEIARLTEERQQEQQGKTPLEHCIEHCIDQRTKEITRLIDAGQQSKTATEQELLRELDAEVRARFVVLGDKLLVRLVQEDAQKSKGGIFLVDENAQTDRAVLVGVGTVSYRNQFAEPILSRLMQIAESSGVKKLDRVELLLSKSRQDSHEYRYKGQTYLFVPCVFALAADPFYVVEAEVSE